jgi:hypothetical protein
LIAVGYLPFMGSPGFMLVSQRTFLIIVPGVALAMTSVLYLVPRRSIALVIGGGLICLGFVAQIYQYDRYARLFNLTWPYLVKIANLSDPQKSIHLVMDETGLGPYPGGLYITKVRFAPPLLRNSFSDRYFLCERGELKPSNNFYSCDLKDGVWLVRNRAATLTFRENAVDAMTLSGNLQEPVNTERIRFKNGQLFEAADSMFHPSQEVGESYACTADGQWGYFGFCRGEGWSDGAVTRRLFGSINYFSAIAPETALFFFLRPAADRDYILEVRFAAPVPEETVADAKLAVNGVAVVPAWRGRAILAAKIPRDLFRAGDNDLRFNNVLPHGADAGFPIRGVELAPVAGPAAEVASP